ncbi:MAG: hypothetical protein EKE20_02210 [Candidatus Symbiopectobacterium sp. Dall1.0]|nr:hypothetical protein [Candidatus Symbiopectobacterium sp. Dall1.0]
MKGKAWRMAGLERFTAIYKKANRKMVCDVYHIIVTDLLVHMIVKHITINLLFSIDYRYYFLLFDRPLRSNSIKILLIQPIVCIPTRVYFDPEDAF